MQHPWGMTFNEFSVSRGVSSTPPSFPEYHRTPRAPSKAAQRTADRRVSTELREWQAQRDALLDEYNKANPEWVREQEEDARRQRIEKATRLRLMAAMTGPRQAKKLIAEAIEIEAGS